MDAKDLQTRWKEVVKVCSVELDRAPTSKRMQWKAAKEAAENVVKALHPVTDLERKAMNAWHEARLEESSKPKPSLRLVKK